MKKQFIIFNWPEAKANIIIIIIIGCAVHQAVGETHSHLAVSRIRQARAHVLHFTSTHHTLHG